MALNTKFPWNTNGDDFDVETVYLHENGHALGLGHSEVVGAVMEAVYDGKRRMLHQDDIDGISFLYSTSSAGASPTVTISSPTESIFALDDPITFTATATDEEDEADKSVLVEVLQTTLCLITFIQLPLQQLILMETLEAILL